MMADRIRGMPPKLLVVGLDAADPKHLIRWCDAGILPTLAGIRAGGVCGELQTPEGMADDAAWASFSTCVSPALHKRYHFRGIARNSYDTYRFRPCHFEYSSFWDTLSEAGKRVAAIDVPKSPVADRLNGIEIRDFRVHGREGRSTSSVPPEIAADLVSRFGDDRADSPSSDSFLCGEEQLSERLRPQFFEELRQSIADKTNVALELLDDGPWDLFMVVFKEAHCAGHQFWPPDCDVRNIYQMLDTAVHKLVDMAGADCTVIVFSTLGMVGNYTGNHLLDAVLRRLERGLVSPWKYAMMAADRFSHRVRRRLRMPSEHSRYRMRLAYPVEFNELSGAVRINLAGRDPNGLVQPGPEAESLMQWLQSELEVLTDPATGRSVVETVLRSDEQFPGRSCDHLPDLLVVWSREAPINAVASPTIGVVSSSLPTLRSGNHIPGGMYFARGPKIDAGAAASPASIMDIGPTIAELLSTALEDVDGVPIRSIAVG